MAKSYIDAAVAAENTQGRKSEGPGVSFTAPSAKPQKGKPVARENAAAGDPALGDWCSCRTYLSDQIVEEKNLFRSASGSCAKSAAMSESLQALHPIWNGAVTFSACLVVCSSVTAPSTTNKS